MLASLNGELLKKEEIPQSDLLLKKIENYSRIYYFSLKREHRVSTIKIKKRSFISEDRSFHITIGSFGLCNEFIKNSKQQKDSK
jgi:hypothetical protein